MYVWYLPEFLLMTAEEDVVNKLVKTRRLIQAILCDYIEKKVIPQNEQLSINNSTSV
jgi:hypothetical protein